MKKLLFSLMTCAFALQINAQHACDGQRYIEPIFTTVDSTAGILFGNGNTFAGNNQDLFMDIYEPSGDTLSYRPVVVLAFGGSFIGGAREDMDFLCRYYAERGFVTVTIDYRLYDGDLIPLPTATAMTDVVVKAVSDMKAAIRYLREDADNGNPYRINPDLIFAGGISAGGIVADHAGLLDSTDTYDNDVATAIASNGGWEGNSSTNFQYSSSIQGILNFSGALKSAGYIDANDPPIFSAHDDGDGTVPYGSGNATIFTIPIIAMEGSEVMHQMADSMGIYNSLITITNSTGHVSYFGGSSTWRDSVEMGSCVFLEYIVCSTPAVGVEALEEIPASKVYPNPSVAAVNLELGDLPSDYTVHLVNAMGQVVHHQANMNDAFVRIERNQLPAGMYILQVQFEKSNVPLIQHKLIFH